MWYRYLLNYYIVVIPVLFAFSVLLLNDLLQLVQLPSVSNWFSLLIAIGLSAALHWLVIQKAQQRDVLQERQETWEVVLKRLGQVRIICLQTAAVFILLFIPLPSIPLSAIVLLALGISYTIYKGLTEPSWTNIPASHEWYVAAKSLLGACKGAYVAGGVLAVVLGLPSMIGWGFLGFIYGFSFAWIPGCIIGAFRGYDRAYID
jgi:hypothetical protein